MANTRGPPALVSGGDFAVLLGVTVLRRDEFRAQRHDLAMAGANDHRRDGAVKMGDWPFGVPNTGTVRAVDVLGLGVAAYQALWEALEELSQINAELLRRNDPLKSE